MLWKSDLQRPRCLFHCHTCATDGRATLEDYFVCAEREGIERLVFLEHIRREPTYDVEHFAEEIRRLSASFARPAHVGFEAKLLTSGEVDIRAEHRQLAEVLGIAEHGFPANGEMLRVAFERSVTTWRAEHWSQLLVWVHPGLCLARARRTPTSEPAYSESLRLALAHGVLIERNLKYGLISAEGVRSLPRDQLVVGLDAHDLDAVRRWIKLSDTDGSFAPESETLRAC